MIKNVDDIVSGIRQLCERSKDEGEYTYQHDEKMQGLCESLSKHTDYNEWAPLLYEQIEEFDEVLDLTIGSPGPLVHVLESADIQEFRKFLLASIGKKPTSVAMSMATTFAVSQNEDRGSWVKIFNNVLAHPEATTGAKEIANDVLENNFYQ